MRLDPDKVRANARASSTEDLLDRVTVFRAGLEPEAVAILQEELRTRGVSAAEQVDHEARRRRSAVLGDDGEVLSCELCRRPATWRGPAWRRLWGVVPLFPRTAARCDEHRPK